MEKKVLGRGIGALIPERVLSEEGEKLINIPLSRIKPNSHQPREDFDEESLGELTASIKEKGVIQPVIVRKSGEGYELIAGERRLRAAKTLNLEKIPAIIRDTDNQNSLELALIENVQRRDLNPLEEAKAYKRLMEEFELTQEQISVKVGKSRSTVANILRLLGLPKEAQEAIRKGEITHAHGKVLLEVTDASAQLKLLRQIISVSLSVRELEGRVSVQRPAKMRKISSAPLDAQAKSLQDDLQRHLGTKVRIIPRKKRGTIQIDFYSLTDLERIINIIKK